MSAKILEGNVLETLKDLPACSVQCVVTSPPYYGLRDYGMDGQIGLEETPEVYVETMVNVFREVRRVLKDDGTLWLNLGDSYWGGKGQSSQAWSTEHQERDTLQKSQHQITGKGETRPTDGKHPVIKPKDLIGIPWMVAFALRADGWYLRQDIIWAKPNPMPESVTDRCTKSHEYIFLMSKSRSYFYDYEAIKEPLAQSSISRLSQDIENQKGSDRVPGKTNGNMKAVRPHGIVRNRKLGYDSKENALRGSKNINAEGLKESMLPEPEDNRNKRSVWVVTTKPYKGAHFATFPPDLIEPCILAGSKEGDTVLDPFNGSGTTGAVALKHHRHYVGCELNPKYIKLTNRRLAQVQPVLFQGQSLTKPAPDAWESAPLKPLFTLEVDSDLGNVPTPTKRR